MKSSRSLLFRSLPIRLWAALFLLFILVAVLQAYLTRVTLESGVLEGDQREAVRIVNTLSAELNEHLSPNFSRDSVYVLLARFFETHPTLLPIIVNNQGEVLVSAVGESFFLTKSLDIRRLRDGERLASEGNFPFLIRDPRENERLRPFATKEVQIGNGSGFVVLLVDSSFPEGSAFWSQFASTERFFTIGILVSFLLSALVALFLSYFFTKRLRLLTSAVKGFRSGNARDFTSIPKYSSDEVGELSHAFSEMQQEIQAYIVRLEERDALRRDLVTGISHDLRTPLTSIRGYARTLKERLKKASFPEEVGFTEIIERNAEHLSSLVEGLFELSTLDDIVERRKNIRFSVTDLLSDLKGRFNLIAEKQGLKLDLNLPSNDIALIGDPALIERAVSNLIENAIRYSQQGTSVNINAESSHSEINISVSDSGPGISDEEIGLIFEKFFRGDKARRKESAGSGLGLAVTKRIIEGHGGTVSVKSEIGKGAEFRICFPSQQN